MKSTIFLLVLAVCPNIFAQPKPVLTPADYGKWETLGQGTLSPDGKWLAHEIRRTDGNNELRVSPTAGGKTHVIAFCSAAAFSADSQWLACETTVAEAEQDRLRKARRPVQNKLSVLDLATGAVTTVDDVQTFAFAGDKSYVAFRRYPPARDNAAAPAANTAAGRGGRGGAAAPGADGESDPVGTPLTVRNLANAVDTTFGNVTAYAWQENGTNLAMTIGLEGRAGNSLQVFDPRAGSLRVLDSGPALFADLVWRKESSDLAALRSVKKDGYEGESYTALAWKNLGEKRSAQVEAPKRIVAARTPQWSEDGSTVYVGIALWLKKPETHRSDDDPSTVEVWHWKDVNVVSEQRMTAARDRDRNALAAWHIESGKLVPLSTNPKEDVRLSKRGSRALALDGIPYEVDGEFGRRYTNISQVNLETGVRTAVASKVVPPVDFSPGGRYALQFKGGDFWIYDLEANANRDISKDAPTSFTNKENDHPVEQKPSYGVAGWTRDDHSVIVYDAYDLWELFPDGKTKPRRLTNGAAEEVRHRYVRIEPRTGAGGGRGGRGGRGGGGEDPEWIDLAKPVYLSLEGRWTKRTGYARLVNGNVERLVWVEKGVRGLEKAKDADVLLYQAGAWDDSPNFFVAGMDLKSPKRVSDTNPFASQYAWGRADLIDFKNSKGDRLQGALYYPANYERGKKYPMIVQIYEIESNQLHNWTAPSERTTYNPAVWTQRGYFVYRPDIVFRPREPGISALDCVTSGVKKVLESGMVDAKKVGLVGHSWGGFETTFIATQTDMFAAAVAGGPLTNLASSYGEIYWNSGGPETDHAETGQERMEVPLYEDPQAYIRNSAVYFANKLHPPLLLSVGDHDGASDWHQDIELYNSARRAGKTVVMLVYEGENHSVAQKANQLDYHRRINDWFDTYLKGNDPKDWITKGVTVLDRERELKSNGQTGGRGTINSSPVGTVTGGGQQ